MSAAKAVVMIPRTAIKPDATKEVLKSPPRTTSPGFSSGSDETDSGTVSPTAVSPTGKSSGSFGGGGSSTKRSERVKVKQRDWRSSIEAYNAL